LVFVLNVLTWAVINGKGPNKLRQMPKNALYCVNAYQLPTPTFYYMHECQDSLIQCYTSMSFVSIPIP